MVYRAENNHRVPTTITLRKAYRLLRFFLHSRYYVLQYYIG